MSSELTEPVFSDDDEPEHQRPANENSPENNLVIDTEQPASPIATSSSSSSLNSTVICTADGWLYLVADENAPLPRLPSGSVVLGVDDPWPKVRYLYRSTSVNDQITVYKTMGADHISSSASMEKPSASAIVDDERLLICFLCNLSFSSTLTFLCHIKEHDVHLSADERQLIVFEQSASAIVHNYCVDNASSSKQQQIKCIVSILMKDEEKTQLFSSNTSQLVPAPSSSAITISYANLEQDSTPTSSTYCNLHPEGKGVGVECPKCDLILGSSRSLGGHMTMMHSRNSCKTLKCPKCNWHYKYQETLEIHMKEKHSDAPTTCPYCVSNTPHPRLGRGEQWSCGYK